MARTLAEILRRFRPAVAPGPAAPAGVPADKVAEAEAELGPVFAALEGTVAEARSVRDEAQADAELRRRRGAEEADRTVAEARGRLEAVRAEAASEHLAALEADRVALETAARAEVERVRKVSDERLPGVVAKVLEEIWTTAGIAPRTGAPEGRDEVAG